MMGGASFILCPIHKRYSYCIHPKMWWACRHCGADITAPGDKPHTVVRKEFTANSYKGLQQKLHACMKEMLDKQES